MIRLVAIYWLTTFKGNTIARLSCVNSLERRGGWLKNGYPIRALFPSLILITGRTTTIYSFFTLLDFFLHSFSKSLITYLLYSFSHQSHTDLLHGPKNRSSCFPKRIVMLHSIISAVSFRNRCFAWANAVRNVVCRSSCFACLSSLKLPFFFAQILAILSAYHTRTLPARER